MASRITPAEVLRALRKLDADLGLVWNDRFTGWEFTFQGKPQGSVLFHDDGVKVQELSVDETVRLAHRGRVNYKVWRAEADANERRMRAEQQKISDARRDDLAYEVGHAHQAVFNPRTYSLPRNPVHA